MSTEPVETFVFLPYSKYKALNNRPKKVETEGSLLPVLDERHLDEEVIDVSISTSTTSEPEEEARIVLGKDLTKTYRGVQINKLIRHIEKQKVQEM